jgi:hypothetical protein
LSSALPLASGFLGQGGGAGDQDHAEPLSVHPQSAAGATHIERIYEHGNRKLGHAHMMGNKHIQPKATSIIYLLQNTIENRTKIKCVKSLLLTENLPSIVSSKYIT